MHTEGKSVAGPVTENWRRLPRISELADDSWCINPDNCRGCPFGSVNCGGETPDAARSKRTVGKATAPWRLPDEALGRKQACSARPCRSCLAKRQRNNQAIRFRTKTSKLQGTGDLQCSQSRQVSANSLTLPWSRVSRVQIARDSRLAQRARRHPYAFSLAALGCLLPWRPS